MDRLPGGNLQEIADLIRLAVAPIFFLMAVATSLMVLTGRLSRVVDRGRSLEHTPGEHGPDWAAELRALDRRVRLIVRALTMGVFSALCICLLMTCAFVGALFHINTAWIVASFFLLALFVYAGALIALLVEVSLAVDSYRLGLQRADISVK